MIRMTALRCVTALLIGVTLPSLAEACSIAVDTVGPTTWSGGDGRGYDVFDGTVYFQPLSLNVKSLEGSCSFYVTVSASVTGGGALGLLSGGAGQLVFEVYRDTTGTQALRPAPLATQSEVLTGSIGKDGQQGFQVAYSIPALQIVPPGTYSGQITIAAYEGVFGSGVLRAQKQVPISVAIPSIAEVSFTEGTFNAKNKYVSVDFGTLYQGEIKGITLHARGNGGYRITADSQNGGSMRQRDPLEPSAVPYILSLDGRPADLSRPDVEAVSFQGITSAQGNAHRFDFTIGSLAGTAAGDYEDTVTVTITSLR